MQRTRIRRSSRRRIALALFATGIVELAPAFPAPAFPAGAAETAAPRVAALSVLLTVPIENERPSGYRRSLFSTWTDADEDGCDTRAEVLSRDSTSPVQVDPTRCTVVAGDWTSPYDGRKAVDPSDLDIDHTVSLKEAWDSGAWSWTPERRTAYANDLSDRRTLRTVSASSNRSKGDNDPSNWLPMRSDVCRFVGDWIAIKARWRLSADRSEWGRLRNLLRDRCPGLAIDVARPPPSLGSQPLGLAQLPTTRPGPSPSVHFRNCTEARAAGAAPLRRGDPGYRPALDGDGDGIACQD